MEFLFILISLIGSFIFFFGVIFLAIGDIPKTIREVRGIFSSDMGILMGFLVFMLAMVFFITLCAMNNTYWHIDYMSTSEGLWKQNDRIE